MCNIAKNIFTRFNKIMKITQVQNQFLFKSNSSQAQPKREFIDIIADNVKNPRDVNDCVAVPRGIFKAYIYLMAGSGLMSISNFIPAKFHKSKTALNIIGATLGIISAVYFAKPFAFKGLAPTVKRENVK